MFTRLRYGLLVSLVFVSTAGAQSPSAAAANVDTVRYERGLILTRPIPSARPFRIIGDRVTPRGTADLVRVTVTPEEHGASIWPWTWPRILRPRGRSIERCWVASSDDAKEFAVLVDELQLGASYRVTMEFLGRGGDVDPEPAVQRAVGDLVEIYDSTRSVSLEEGRAALSRRMAEYREELGTTSSTEFVRLDEDGRCPARTEPEMPFSQAQLQAIAEAGADAVIRARAADGFSADAAVLDSLARFASGLTDRLRAAKQAELTAIAARRGQTPKLLFTPEDLEALDRTLQGKWVISGPVLIDTAADRHLNSATISRFVRDADRRLLADLLTISMRLRVKQEQFKSHAASADLAASYRTALRDRYFRQAQADLGTQRPWAGETEVRRVQIGTAYGGGFVFLDVADQASDDAFAFVALKFYSAPVDKTLPNAYSSGWARFAFNLGAVSNSTIRYRGQAQENAIAGLKPLVGMSFDVTRRIAVHGGAVIFRQPSTNPLATSDHDRLKAQPFLAVGFDFDAINEVISLAGKANR